MRLPPARIRRNPNTHPFLFATGIENSYPIVLANGGRRRVDEMEKTFHYQHWREDFQLVKDLGIDYLRYGPPYYRTHLGAGKYDWDFTDETFAELRRLKIEPITDLCHFGVPDWIGDFQNSDFPCLFAQYAGAFAKRFPWVRFYTPVNEIFVCARFSGRLGWWNECLGSDRGFVIALKHLCKANILAEEKILEAQPDALFIQSESTEYFHAEEPDAFSRAVFLNQMRFLSLDFCYGTDVTATMHEFLMENGMTDQEYFWFMDRGFAIKPYCIMGNDYYATNEHLVPKDDGPLKPAGDMFGYYIITREYFDRYRLPVMHTETNQRGADSAPGWLARQWANMVHLKNDGVPIIGFTWYSLVDQVDWDTLLLENNGTVNHLGLYDLDRKITPVGLAYCRLVQAWREILPMEGHGLDMHRCRSRGNARAPTCAAASSEKPAARGESFAQQPSVPAPTQPTQPA